MTRQYTKRSPHWKQNQKENSKNYTGKKRGPKRRLGTAQNLEIPASRNVSRIIAVKGQVLKSEPGFDSYIENLENLTTHKFTPSEIVSLHKNYKK